MVNAYLKYLVNTIVRLPNVISKTNQAQNAHAIHVIPVADLGCWGAAKAEAQPTVADCVQAQDSLNLAIPWAVKTYVFCKWRG